MIYYYGYVFNTQHVMYVKEVLLIFNNIGTHYIYKWTRLLTHIGIAVIVHTAVC